MENAYSARLWFGFGLAVGAAASALLTWALIYCRAHGNRSKEE